MWGAGAFLQDLGMGSFVVPTKGKNFVSLTSAVLAATGLPAASALAVNPAQVSLYTANGIGLILDQFTADLSLAGWARNGFVVLSLAASTPITLDLTNLNAQAVWAGDYTFTAINEVEFVPLTLTGTVVVSPGATNPWSGQLGGTAPNFTVYPGRAVGWRNPNGWPVSFTARNLKFDPGPTAAVLAVGFGGSY